MTVLLATGDLVLETGDAAALLAEAVAVLAEGDIVLGHLEIPHVDGGTVLTTDVPAIPGPPAALDAVAGAGFTVLSLAGNHVFDFGPEGIEQTRQHCEDRGILTVGTGSTLDEALAPVTVSLKDADRDVAVLSINCVGPRETWATSSKPGCAYIEIITHYEPRGANPGGPPRISTFAEPRSLMRATESVRAAAETGAVVVVALHKGLVHVPVELAQYERDVAHALVDAGASVIIGHHAHILRGIEVYRGRPIFHGLGNFATATNAMSATGADDERRASWAHERVRLFGFVPDPAMPTYPFHPESRNTALAWVEFGQCDAMTAAVLPFWIDETGRPVPAPSGERGRSVAQYIRRITAEAGFVTEFEETSRGLSIRLEGAVT